MALWKEAHLHHVLCAPLQVSYHSVNIAILSHHIWAALELPFVPWTCTVRLVSSWRESSAVLFPKP
jgi:hypothetical protein